MIDEFGFPSICQILLIIIFAGQTTLMCKGQPLNRQYNDSSDSVPKLSDLIESILRQISAPRGNSSVIVHINNLYCVTGSQDVQINPCKHQSINLARGDQLVNSENLRELTKRSLPRKSPPNSKQMSNEPHHTDSMDPDQGHHCLSERHHLQSDESWIQPTTKPIVKVRPYSQSVETLEKTSREKERQPWNRDSFNLDVPALNIYIDGKPLTDANTETHSHEGLSSKLFEEEIRELLLEGNKNSVGKRPLCNRTEEPPCERDMVTVHGGLELSYEEFRKIIEDVSEKPDFVKCIVPGGVSGPLTGYFQNVDKSLHEHALVHGVCLLHNGLLVPLTAMLRILKLHAWLCEAATDFANEDVRKLHSSIKCTQTDSIVDLLRCFVKSNKIHVVLPSGTSRVPFAQFEQEEEHIPNELLQRAQVEMLGFLIPYIHFRDKLVALCRENSN